MDRIELFGKYLSEKRNSTIVHEHYLNTVREYAPGTDLYMREMHFLTAADPGTPVSISHLAQKLGVTLGAASQMATKLEKKGLLCRYPDPEDRRRTMVRLTEEGIRLYREHLEYDYGKFRVFSEMFSDFTDEEVLRLIEAERIFQRAISVRDEEN